MKWESVLAWRVQRQHLARRADDAFAVTSDLCGLHAQVMSSAQLTLWARMDDPPDVEDLLWRQRTLVKTWTLRGTLHLLPPDELPLYTGAQAGLKPRYEQKSWLKHFELTAEDAQRHPRGRPGGAPARAADARAAGVEGPPGPEPRLRRPAQAGRVPR